jgi:DNA-binding beta-propeller fold protein YncE
MSIIDEASNNVFATVPLVLGTLAFDYTASQLTISADGRYVYLNNGQIFSTATNAAAETRLPEATTVTTTSDGPQCCTISWVTISPDGQRLYVALQEGNTSDPPDELGSAIDVYDVPTGTVVASIPLSAWSLSGMVISPDGKTLYASFDEYIPGFPGNDYATAGDITVISTETNSVVNTFNTGNANPYDLAITPDGKSLFTYLRYDSGDGYGVSSFCNAVISTSDGSIESTLGSSEFYGFVPAPNGQFMYANGEIISIPGLAVTPAPWGENGTYQDAGNLAVNKSGTVLYSANPNNAVDVYALSNNSLIKTIPVAGGPGALDSVP